MFSDYVCPFCYLDESVLQRLQEEHGDRLRVDYRAFELRPEPVPMLDPDGPYLDDVWRHSVLPLAEERGIEIDRPPVQPRSRRALEAAEFARDAGAFREMHRAIYRAFFREGRDLADLEVLLEIGASAGLDREALREALEDGRYTEKVLADQLRARELEVSGVPAHFVHREGKPLEEGIRVPGAQPFETVDAAVREVLEGSASGEEAGPELQEPLDGMGPSGGSETGAG